MIFLAKATSGGLEGVAQLFTVFLMFVFVLFLTYFSTRWIAKLQKGKINSENIDIIETYKITPNKYIQIVRIGNSYFAIAVAKDTVTFLGELDENELTFTKVQEGVQPDFKAFLDKARNLRPKKQGNEDEQESNQK